MGEGRVGVSTTLPPVPIRYRARFRALPCTLVVQGLPPPLKGGGNQSPHKLFQRSHIIKLHEYLDSPPPLCTPFIILPAL